MFIILFNTVLCFFNRGAQLNDCSCFTFTLWPNAVHPKPSYTGGTSKIEPSDKTKVFVNDLNDNHRAMAASTSISAFKALSYYIWGRVVTCQRCRTVVLPEDRASHPTATQTGPARTQQVRPKTSTVILELLQQQLQLFLKHANQRPTGDVNNTMLLLHHFSYWAPLLDAAVAATHRVPEESPVELKLHILLQEAGVSSRVPGQFLQGRRTIQ